MLFKKNRVPGESTRGRVGHPDRTAESSSYLNAENMRILSLLANDYIREKKIRRRWGLFFKLLIVSYIGIMTFYYFDAGLGTVSDRHTSLVELSGVIGPDATTASQINRSLQKAFAADSSVGVILDINSPGGSPVQAAQINEEIIRLKTLYPTKPFYVTISDVCTSGGYYIAAAADQIFAHPSSIVGSIGVQMNGFGFVETLKKLGIERRLLVAGKNKGILDPFSPRDVTQERHAQKMLDEVHRHFITAVKMGRGERLLKDDIVFSGLFWSGQRAKEMGLIDGFGSIESVAREVIGTERLIDYTLEPTLFERFAEEVGVTFGTVLFNQFLRFF